MNELVEVVITKVLQSSTYTVVLLGDDTKQFCIYMEPHIGQMIQQFFSNEKSERPQTYEFFDRFLLGLNVTVKRVIINKVEGSVFFCKILCEQLVDGIKNLVEIDARPSDCFILALRHKVPIFCDSQVFESVLEYVE